MKYKEITFSLKEEFIPLNALLKYLGIAESGADANAMIESGLVNNGKLVETRKRYKVKKGDVIVCQNQSITIV